MSDEEDNSKRPVSSMKRFKYPKTLEQISNPDQFRARLAFAALQENSAADDEGVL